MHEYRALEQLCCIPSSANGQNGQGCGQACVRMHKQRWGREKERVSVHTLAYVCLSQLCPSEELRAWTLINQGQDISDHVGAETLCHAF